jgi:hypothetical protein
MLVGCSAARIATVSDTGNETPISPHRMYSRDSIYATREMAMQEVRRLVAKYLTDQWRICRDDQNA